MIEFFENLGLFRSIFSGVAVGVCLAILLILIKIIFVLIVQSKFSLKIIEYPFKGIYFKRMIKLAPVFFYSPVVDNKNMNLTDAIKLEDKGWFKDAIENPLQLQDDSLVNKQNAPFIYFNPETMEVYGSFILMIGRKYQTKYFSAKLVEKVGSEKC
ncbi:hypothetical protein [Acinetobacter nosocomialis]|uniref:hypothetical protein n=1 Tax=Acinetobacter nosocomialis TaxID=106654 RepID=UPI001F2BA051|nr:hypothetical protein [Acinetobacter nosocomialis]MCE7534206.1 hypothetical protein [Acinetobacter nosocomialis]